MNNTLLKDEYVKLIFSFKVKKFRQRKKLSISDLSGITGLSASYLSEIEKGVKYPKPEKIALIGRALDVSFDELVTVKLEEGMSSLSLLLNSNIWSEFPFEQFGLSVYDIFRLLTDSPSKAGALIKTIYEIGKNYDMQSEHFLLATLRSFQIMNMNYFAEAEDAAKKFIQEYDLDFDGCRDYDKIRELLSARMAVEIDTETLHRFPELKGFRSVYKQKNGRKILMINPALDKRQHVFIFLKEIGYQYMKYEERATSFTMFKPRTFNEVFHNFITSYFAGAVLMNTKEILKDLKEMFAKPVWQPQNLTDLLTKYKVTPETLLHRFSQLLPKYYNFTNIHYMRFMRRADGYTRMDKELNISDVFTARGSNEHHCAKWLALKSLDYYKNRTEKELYGVYAQRSNFIKTQQEFFNITICRTMNINQDTHSSMTLGILNNDEFKKKVRFWDDKQIARVSVNETCERCYLSANDCTERLAPPIIYEKEKREEHIRYLLQTL